MYKPGQHKFVCDVCGFEFFSSEKRKRWDGLIVCPTDYETDHPQKYIKVQSDGQAVPDARPSPDDVFVDHICYIYASQSYADISEADCMRADTTDISYVYAQQLKGVT